MSLLPIRDPSRPRRLWKIALWLGGIAVAVVICQLFGVDVSGWLSSLWDTLSEIAVGYLVAGWALQTVQTTLTALGWYFILAAAHPRAAVPYRQILAAYATGVALNGLLPANIGTFVMLLMFVAIIPGATFPGVLGGMGVQKIFFPGPGALVSLCLFASVPESSELQLRAVRGHPVLVLGVVRGRGSPL